MTRHKSYKTLQAGRGIAALMVVVHHASGLVGTTPRYWQDQAYAKPFFGGALGVEFFFVLSGIVMILAHTDDKSGIDSFRSFAWKRFRRIYPIYWFVLAFVAAIYIARPALGFGHEGDPWVLLSSVLLVHIHSTDVTLHVAWTLFHEVMFYAFFALALLHRRAGLALMALWMALSLLTIFEFGLNPWLGDFLSPLNALFGLGMVSAWILRTRPSLPWPAVLFPGTAITACVLIWCGHVGLISNNVALIGGIGSAFLIVGLIELERRERLTVWPWLIFLGDASYAIYLVHFPALSFLMRPLYSLSQRSSAPVFVWWLLSITLATAAGIGVHLWIELPILNRLPKSLKLKRQAPVIIESTGLNL